MDPWLTDKKFKCYKKMKVQVVTLDWWSISDSSDCVSELSKSGIQK